MAVWGTIARLFGVEIVKAICSILKNQITIWREKREKARRQEEANEIAKDPYSVFKSRFGGGVCSEGTDSSCELSRESSTTSVPKSSEYETTSK